MTELSSVCLPVALIDHPIFLALTPTLRAATIELIRRGHQYRQGVEIALTGKEWRNRILGPKRFAEWTAAFCRMHFLEEVSPDTFEWRGELCPVRPQFRSDLGRKAGNGGTPDSAATPQPLRADSADAPQTQPSRAGASESDRISDQIFNKSDIRSDSESDRMANHAKNPPLPALPDTPAFRKLKKEGVSHAMLAAAAQRMKEAGANLWKEQYLRTVVANLRAEIGEAEQQPLPLPPYSVPGGKKDSPPSDTEARAQEVEAQRVRVAEREKQKAALAGFEIEVLSDTALLEAVEADALERFAHYDPINFKRRKERMEAKLPVAGLRDVPLVDYWQAALQAEFAARHEPLRLRAGEKTA